MKQFVQKESVTNNFIKIKNIKNLFSNNSKSLNNNVI